MTFGKAMLSVLGIILLLFGLLFFGQGLGLIRWPAESFMIDQSPWIVRGALLAIAGAALIWFSRRG